MQAGLLKVRPFFTSGRSACATLLASGRGAGGPRNCSWPSPARRVPPRTRGRLSLPTRGPKSNSAGVGFRNPQRGTLNSAGSVEVIHFLLCLLRFLLSCRITSLSLHGSSPLWLPNSMVLCFCVEFLSIPARFLSIPARNYTQLCTAQSVPAAQNLDFAGLFAPMFHVEHRTAQ